LLRRIGDAVPAPVTGGVDPDTAVAAGAAVLGRGMHVVVDVVPMSVGMMVPGGMSQEIIAPSSAVPTTRRIGIARPPAGPLVVAFYEATSSTATEREMLGSIKVDPDWLAKNAGDITLDVHLDRNLDLNCEVKSKSGGALKLQVIQPKK
jgi:molecular chaperone DnaK